MASSETEAALKEMIPFLKWHSPYNYKKEILENMLGTTGTSEGMACLSKNVELMNSLSWLVIEDRSLDIQEKALKILVNLSTIHLAKEVSELIMRSELLEVVLKFMLNKKFPSANYCAMLLANLTLENSRCETVYKMISKNNNLSVESLLDVFCDVKYNEACDLEHVGSLLANLTLLKEARDQFLEQEKMLIKKILPFTQFMESSVRRYSAAAIIKNCLFETEHHEWLISDDVELSTYLLLPLAGPEELDADETDALPLDLQYLPPDKTRETSTSIQILLIESLFQLCATKQCRLKLKSSGVYYILREFHKSLGDSLDENIELPLENTIQVLIGDEPGEGNENIREIEIPEHIKKHFEEQDEQTKSPDTCLPIAS